MTIHPSTALPVYTPIQHSTLYRPIFSYTVLYTPINSYGELYTPKQYTVHPYAALYIHPYWALCTIIQHYKVLYSTSIQNYTPLHSSIHHCTALYKKVQHYTCTSLYIISTLLTPLNIAIPWRVVEHTQAFRRVCIPENTSDLWDV